MCPVVILNDFFVLWINAINIQLFKNLFLMVRCLQKWMDSLSEFLVQY